MRTKECDVLPMAHGNRYGMAKKELTIAHAAVDCDCLPTQTLLKGSAAPCSTKARTADRARTTGEIAAMDNQVNPRGLRLLKNSEGA